MSIFLEFRIFIVPLYLIYVLLQLFVGIYLFYRFYKTKFRNLIPLALFFILTSFEGVMSLLEFNIIIQVHQFIPNLVLLFFIQYTFYKDRKSPFKILFFSIITLKVINFSIALIFPISIPMTASLTINQLPFYYIYLVIVFVIISLSELWLAYSALSYYFSNKKTNLEPWVKKRYLLIGIAALILSLEGVLWLFLPPSPEGFENPQSFIIGFLVVIVYTLFTLTSLIVWIMPKKLKNFFNRNYKNAHDNKLSEEELLSQIRLELRKNPE